MLTGRSELPVGFNPSAPRATDWPSLAAVAGVLTRPRNNLPPAVVLPERLVHNTGRVIPGQFAGIMGARRDPWFIEAAPFDPAAYGAFPEYEFDHQERKRTIREKRFEAPMLAKRTPAAFEGLQSESCPQRVAITIVRSGSPPP